LWQQPDPDGSVSSVVGSLAVPAQSAKRTTTCVE
jgi:hypothetical protein